MIRAVAVSLFLALPAAAVADDKAKPADEAKVKAAATTIRDLEKAAGVYYVSFGEYPPKLDTLADPKETGGRPFIERKMLTDPWGKPYQYDAKKLHPITGRPKIWTTTPDGKPLENW